MNNKSCFKAGVILVFLCVAMLMLFNVFCNNNRLNADSSSEMVLGDMLSEAGTPISPEWCYSTEVRLLNTQLITTPLFMITDNWHVVRAVSNLILYLILLASYIFFMRGMRMKYGYILLSSVLFMLPVSMESVDIIHVGAFYIPHLVMLFVTMGLYFRRDDKKCLVLLVILSFFSGASGIRYLITIQLPLLVAAMVMYYKTERSRILPALISFVSFCAGFLCNHFMHRIFMFYDETSVSFYQNTNPVERLGMLVDGILELFGFRLGAPVKSAGGLASVAAVVLLLLAGIMLRRKIRGFKAGERNFVFVFFVSAFLINTLIFLLGGDEVYDARYYFPVLIMLVPLAAEELSGDKIRWLPALLAVGIVMASGGFTLFEAAGYDRNEHRYESIKYLTENGYDFGYSTFWNANITTELSNGKIRMANISEDFEEIKPYMWLTPKKYYDGSIKPEKPFILLTRDEYERAEGKFGSELLYEDESFVILNGKPDF